MKFEYLIESANYTDMWGENGDFIFDNDSKLSDLGKQGWELAGILRTDAPYFFFKRLLKEDTTQPEAGN